MIKVGMMIAERYEIIEKIGMGGMSDVYSAKDHKLNRLVAVKVLKQEFSENTDFVSKFRVEAQAAAGLMHPNIVNVYDVGEENRFHYIVMELVEGITLKKYIEKKARLSVKEAVSIAIQVAMGIEAAHNNHIIHRDIKPQNIIISKEGKVKVTDFGIAKAATSNTITSNVMGSVHYTSPEQVRGGFSDEKSDVYSLGITLFEMLTGRVPFNGDTTVAVAIKHIQEDMPSPREFVPEIPISVEQITLKCTQKSPDKRYQSAPELIEDLKKSLISPDENFVKIDNADTSGVTKTFSDAELASIKRQSHKRDSFEAKIQAVEGEEKNKNKNKSYEHSSDRQQVNQNADEYQDQYQYDNSYPEDNQYEDEYSKEYQDDYQDEYNDEYDRPAEQKKSKSQRPYNDNSSKKVQKNVARNSKNGVKNVPNGNRKKSKNEEDDYDPKVELVTTILIVIVAIFIALFFLIVILKALGVDFDIFGTKNQKTENKVVSENVVTSQDGNGETGGYESGVVSVPGVIGFGKDEAQEQILGNSLKYELEYVNSDDYEKDVVVNQVPEAGSRVEKGSTVKITISLGQQLTQIDMPSLEDLTKEQALEALEVAGFVVDEEKITEEYSDTIDEGKVIRQNPAKGMRVNTGSTVTFVVSMGVEPANYALIGYSVSAPADYQPGSSAKITLIGKDGSNQGSVDTTLPYTVTKGGMYMIPSGTIVLTYINTNGESQTQNIPVTFTKESE